MSLTKSEQTELDNIVAQLGDPESDNRRWAIYDLGQFAPEYTVEHMVRGVVDEHRAVREAAAELLAELPAEAALPHLIPLLGSHRIEVRNIVSSIIGKFGDAAVEPLCQALKHENEDVRKFSADILGLAKSPRAVDVLGKALYDEQANVGISAAEALGKIGSPDALPALIKGFRERDYLQRECSEALGMLGIPEGTHFLMEQFEKADDLLVQFAMIDAMGNAGDSGVIEYLDGLASTPPQGLEAPLALAMLKIAQRRHLSLSDRSRVALDLIVERAEQSNDLYQRLLSSQVSKDQEPEVLQVLAEAWQALAAHTLVALIEAAAHHVSLHEFLVSMTDHPDDWVAYTAIQHLAGVDKGTATAVIQRILDGTRSLPQLAAIKVAPQLELPESRAWIEPFLESPDEDLRAMAEKVLQG